MHIIWQRGQPEFNDCRDIWQRNWMLWWTRWINASQRSECGFIGATPIVASTVPIAAGAALAQKMKVK